jgi:hypothetical protein
MPTCGVGLPVRGRGGEGYPFGIRLDGPRADSGAGPEGFPEVQFHIFIFFSSFLFLFLISYFLRNFCILKSNDSKPIAKVL